MQLPIYPSKSANPCAICPNKLWVESNPQPGMLPRLHGALTAAVPQELTLLLRVHNQAGIPIIEGRCKVSAGQKSVVFANLQAVGIEAYAHVSEVERHHILQRIWSRHAYGTITCL